MRRYVAPMPAPVFSCLPLGTRLTVASQAPELIEAIRDGLCAYPSDILVGGSLHIVAEVVDDSPGDPAWPVITATSAPDSLTVRCGSATVVLDHRTATAHMTLPSSLCAIPEALALLAESVFTSLHVQAGRLHAIHSGLVERDGVGLLLRGPSGAGKSTLTYACMRRGMTVVSDDWVYAPAQAQPGQVVGYPWRIMLTEQAASRFPELAGVPTVPHTGEERRKVKIEPAAELQKVAASVAAVVLLDPDPVLSLEPIEAEPARERFWAASLPTERDHLDDEWVRALLRRPTYLLRRGADPDDAAARLDELATSLR